MACERGERVEAPVVVERVDVVQHEHDRLLACSQRLAELRQPSRPERATGCLQRLEHLVVDRPVGVQGLRDVGEQDDRIVVSMVERQPGKVASVPGGPLCEQRRLPVSRRRDHRDEAAPARSFQSFDDARPLDEPSPLRGRGELRAQEGKHLRLWGRIAVPCSPGGTLRQGSRLQSTPMSISGYAWTSGLRNCFCLVNSSHERRRVGRRSLEIERFAGLEDAHVHMRRPLGRQTLELERRLGRRLGAQSREGSPVDRDCDPGLQELHGVGRARGVEVARPHLRAPTRHRHERDVEVVGQARHACEEIGVACEVDAART
jgi:hypothetical protein